MAKQKFINKDPGDFKPRIKLSYPEFQNHFLMNEALGSSLAYSFYDIDGSVWYGKFINRVFEARDNRQYLPIYRMSDGEYSFLLQRNIYDIIPFSELNWKQKILKLIRNNKKKQREHRSGLSRDGVEHYTETEINNLYQSYLEDLKVIAEKGILALGFDSGKFHGKFVHAVYNLLNENRIFLNPENYYHFYHVYALFSSTYGQKLLQNQNVLIITSLNEEKKSRFNKELSKIGVKRIDYYSISSTKAMKEIIDLSVISSDVNLILVGAGVGSANIIRQLHGVSVPCIDIGAILGAFIEPERKFERPFMLSDNIFDLRKIKFISEKNKLKVQKYFNRNVNIKNQKNKQIT